ncbi:hypothetical protein AB0I85_13065 [Micromonospora echinofusca]|uniref:hypothetical protein n=1 Tax=Micromonospora echinofusca TaxID=47858 RepID=UPI001183A05B|nr:hypothetical protein [Micromonospora sp. MSM11]MCL7456921.1 hypothetical protein [Micromonospora sp. MSM11]
MKASETGFTGGASGDNTFVYDADGNLLLYAAARTRHVINNLDVGATDAGFSAMPACGPVLMVLTSGEKLRSG